MFHVTNPATGETLERIDSATDDQVRDAVARADRGYRDWRQRPLRERAERVAEAGRLFGERADELASIVTTEMGKRTAEARGELHIVEEIFTYYADNAAELLADDHLDTAAGPAVIQKRPIGVILGIMPWNYPYYQVARFVAPNLVLGNTVLLKHAPICPRSAAAIEALLHDAGIPTDAFVNVYASNEQVADIIADPRVAGVSLTGSERAGSAVAAQAGRHLKRVVLELGGSDPMIVLDTDDLEGLIDEAVASRMGNTGQACNAPKRMIVLDDLYDDFVDGMVERVVRLEPGDPSDPATKLAPLSSSEAADRLAGQLERARAQGATVRTGGKAIPGEGAYIEPTVLTDVTPDMDAYREELFGPVAIVFRASSAQEAVALANDTPYGLGASVYSTDREHALRVADQVEAGMVSINSAGGSRAGLPFGGIKRSGIGRELGPLGIEEFMNKKVVQLGQVD